MGKQASYLIIGNGIAGVTAAEVLRSTNKDSAITIIADDPSPVYYRPALKDFLGGHISEKKLCVRPTIFYQKHDIRFIAGRVATISPAQHVIQLQNGEQQRYDKLLLATGAQPRHLHCPGTELAGVSTLRTMTDYQEILRRLPKASRIVICGSGTLALESAEVLRALGYHVTHLLRKQTLWSEILDSTASDMVLQEERRAGIDVHTGETVAEIVGKRGQVTHVLTTTGARLPCDLLLVAIGIAPNIDFIQASGIACGQGVQVDAAMRTNAPDIYAAGDSVETTDALTGHTRIVGQWFPAIQQARTAASSMLDQYDNTTPGIFYNATFLYGLDFVSLGVTSQPMLDHAHSYQEIIAEPAPRNYRKVLLKDGIPIGALFLGERKQAFAFKRAIDARVNLTPILTSLFTEDFPFETWLDKQRVPEAIFDSARNASPAKETVEQAYLIPIAHPKVKVVTRETLLSPLSQNTLIGRQQGIALTIEHRSVSRKHASISCINGRYILRDLSSSNGTFVNALPLPSDKTRVLHSNDTLRFGDVQFRFQLRTVGVELASAQNASATTANPFQHILGSPLEQNTTRTLPESLLATIREKPSLILLMKHAEPRIVPIASDHLISKRLSVGRDQDCAIVLHDTAASRKHAEFFTAPDGLYIRDLKSSNGVFVNTVRITNPYHLSRGDRVVIGNTLIYCSLGQTIEQPDTGSGHERLPEPDKSDPYDEPGVPFLHSAEDTDKKPALVSIGHRRNIETLSKKRVQFEIDMCIGCNRCMTACPVPFSTQMSLADLNQATVSDEMTSRVARFTHECIMCGSCVPVCPVDNHRDLLMLSLKQRLGSPWDSDVDVSSLIDALPPGWSIARLVHRLREQPIFSNTQVVPENYLLHLFAHSQLLTLVPDVTLVREGDYGRDLYLLLEGRLSVVTAEAKGEDLQVAIINRGEYTGEYGMLTGQPYPTTVRTLTPALVLQVPEQVIQNFMELIPRVRHFFEQLNNGRSIESILKRMALFQGVCDADIHALVEQTLVQLYDRNECLFTESDATHLSAGSGRPARETLHILLEGFVKVARQTTEGTGQNKSNERIIAYRQGGDYFAGGLDLLGDGRAVTVTSITRTRVAKVPRPALLALFKRYPEVGQRFTVRLHQYIESTVRTQSRIFEEGLLNPQLSQKPPAAPAVRAGLHSLINDGVVEGTEVLVIDLDKCIHCNECEEACTRRHGHSRMNRKGMVVGNISIATACRQCQDPVCMLCSRAGIARRPNGEVYITESCIGCGICAERCPYGAISIVDLEEEPVSASSSKRFNTFFTKGTGKERVRKSLPMTNRLAVIDRHVSSGPLKLTQSADGYDEMRKKIAMKCDLCAEYSDQACVQACPTGAAIRVQPTKFFGSTEEILRKRTHS